MNSKSLSMTVSFSKRQHVFSCFISAQIWMFNILKTNNVRVASVSDLNVCWSWIIEKNYAAPTFRSYCLILSISNKPIVMALQQINIGTDTISVVERRWKCCMMKPQFSNGTMHGKVCYCCGCRARFEDASQRMIAVQGWLRPRSVRNC